MVVLYPSPAGGTPMPAVFKAGLLFLLLLCDWLGDPHNGRSPFSRPLSSQIVVCRTIGLRAGGGHPLVWRQWELIMVEVPVALIGVLSLWQGTPAISHHPFRKTDLIYWFLTLRR
jgi:hypothetical protein